MHAVVRAAQEHKAVIVMLGGHVVKTGLAPVLIDLMRRGVITHVGMNGSAAIHDYEMARFGATSEDVAAGLRDGTFGMAEETGRALNEAFIAGQQNGWGMGEAVGRALHATEGLAHPELSVLHNAHALGVTATVHAALGAEIIHQHPAASGAAQAELRVKCAACREAIGTSVQSSASLERALLALKNAVALEARQIELLSELLATAQALLHVIEICHTCIRPAGLAASLIAVEAERAVVPVVPDKGLIADQLRAKPEETVQRRFSYGARPPLP